MQKTMHQSSENKEQTEMTAVSQLPIRLLIDVPGSGPAPKANVSAVELPEAIYKYPKNGLSGLL